MQPTVGRMVYYKSYGTPNGEFPSVERAAIITAVHLQLSELDMNNYVDLCVINPTGFFFNQRVKQGPNPGEWDWMPFQKGQAQKTEQLENELKRLQESEECENPERRG